MPKPKTDSRERLIEAAARLFAQQGFESTSLSQIVKESGVPRGSVYFLFPGGKEEIAVATLNHSASRVYALLTGTANNSSTIGEWIRHITATMAHGLETYNYRSGSPLAAIAFDTAGDESEALGRLCHKAYDSWIGETARILHEKFEVGMGKANEMAVFSIGAIEGAVILCRAKRSTEPLATIANTLIDWAEAQME